MRLVDFQNPLANMPMVQQIQQNQHTQAQSVPVTFQQQLENQTQQELTMVQETKEQNEKDQINEEDPQRGDISRRLPRRRAPQISPDKAAEKKSRPSDGIHGRFLDIEV